MARRILAAALCALALAAIGAAWPGLALITLQLAAVGTAVILLVKGLARVAAAAEPEPDAPPARQNVVAGDYERLGRQVDLAVQPGAPVDTFLAHELRDIASALLRRRGVDLRRDPARAEAAVGEDAWQVIRPGHREAGLAGLDLPLVLDRLEAL